MCLFIYLFLLDLKQNFYYVWSWKNIIIINYKYRFFLSPHVINRMWRTWRTSTASVLETKHPGFCIREETSSTTLAFLRVTLTMTLKVKSTHSSLYWDISMHYSQKISAKMFFLPIKRLFFASPVTIYTEIRSSMYGTATRPCPVTVQVQPSFLRDASTTHLDPDLEL